MSQSREFNATVVITTINRPEDLRRSIQSAVEQTPPVEIIVIGDGSPQTVLDMVSQEFPSVRLYNSGETKGISVQRNRAARLATAPIIVSIDDDAAFTSPDTVSRILNAFSSPMVGAVAIPFVDVFRGREHGTNISETDNYVDYHFVGTAYALRKDIFLKLGGFEEAMHFQGEEDDYCARLLNAGYVIRCGCAPPVHHFVSPVRSWEKIAFLSARNSILYAYINVPKPYLMIHFAGTSIINLLSGARKKKLFPTIKGIINGYLACCHPSVIRRPVTRNTYRLIRKLRKHGPTDLVTAQGCLNKVRFD